MPISSYESSLSNALYSLAKDNNALKKYYDYSLKFIDLLDNDKNLLNFYESYFISFNKKEELIDKYFSDYDIYFKNFIKLIIKNHYISGYKYIFEKFISLCNYDFNVIEGIIYSTEFLSTENINKIESALTNKLNKKVILKNKIDESLIGGFKVFVDNKLFDYSYLNSLKQLKIKLNK